MRAVSPSRLLQKSLSMVCCKECKKRECVLGGAPACSPSHPRPFPTGVACVFFNEDYMTCDWGSKGKPAANYSLYYW